MSEREAYVGYCDHCGMICAASVIDPQWKNETARFVRDLVKDGLRVATLTCEQVRAGPWCWCGTMQMGLDLTATPTGGASQ